MPDCPNVGENLQYFNDDLKVLVQRKESNAEEAKCREGKKGVMNSFFDKGTKRAKAPISGEQAQGRMDTPTPEQEEAPPGTTPRHRERSDQKKANWWKRLTWRS